MLGQIAAKSAKKISSGVERSAERAVTIAHETIAKKSGISVGTDALLAIKKKLLENDKSKIIVTVQVIIQEVLYHFLSLIFILDSIKLKRTNTG